MPHPPLVLVDPDAGRRGSLGQGLTAAGYEVVPTVTAAEGLRFARGFESAVVVASADLPEVIDGSLFEASGDGRAFVILGIPETSSALPEDVSFIPTGIGLGTEDLCRKLSLVLVGRELGVDADSRCESLVGDLSLTAFSELLQGLGEARFTAGVELERGTIRIVDGEVRAAESEPVRGKKAFCRLSRLASGPFRVVPGGTGGTIDEDSRIDEDLPSLLLAAIEDSVGEFPDPHTRVTVDIGPEFFARELTALEQRIVQVAQRGASLQAVLDSVPEPDGAVMDDLLRLAERGVAVLEAPKPAIVVVTDSTADLPAHVAREHGIRVVPLKVRFGGETYRDGVDLEPRRFYELLETRAEAPSTEPPAVEDFLHSYREPFEEADIVSVHISAKLSATLEHAGEAARQLLEKVERRPAHLEVVDSRAVSIALGYEAIFAARMAARGVPPPAIRGRLRQIVPRIHILFVVDSLDYLVRGGRIGKARGLIGKLLGIKPILGLKAGEVVPVERVRGGRAAQQRLIELMADRLEAGRPTVAALVHAKAPARADRVGRLLKERFTVSEMLIAEMGPVVGTHVGPGMVGVMGFQPTDEEAELIAPLRES